MKSVESNKKGKAAKQSTSIRITEKVDVYSWSDKSVHLSVGMLRFMLIARADGEVILKTFKGVPRRLAKTGSAIA